MQKIIFFLFYHKIFLYFSLMIPFKWKNNLLEKMNFDNFIFCIIFCKRLARSSTCNFFVFLIKRFKLITLDNKIWAFIRKLIRHQFIFVALSIFCYDSMFDKLNGLMWPHKFGKPRTIITMRFSLASNFGLLFVFYIKCS